MIILTLKPIIFLIQFKSILLKDFGSERDRGYFKPILIYRKAFNLSALCICKWVSDEITIQCVKTSI